MLVQAAGEQLTSWQHWYWPWGLFCCRDYQVSHNTAGFQDLLSNAGAAHDCGWPQVTQCATSITLACKSSASLYRGAAGQHLLSLKKEKLQRCLVWKPRCFHGLKQLSFSVSAFLIVCTFHSISANFTTCSVPDTSQFSHAISFTQTLHKWLCYSHISQ